MKIREKQRMTQNTGVFVKIRETWQVCQHVISTQNLSNVEMNLCIKDESETITQEAIFFISELSKKKK